MIDLILFTIQEATLLANATQHPVYIVMINNELKVVSEYSTGQLIEKVNPSE